MGYKPIPYRGFLVHLLKSLLEPHNEGFPTLQRVAKVVVVFSTPAPSAPEIRTNSGQPTNFGFPWFVRIKGGDTKIAEGRTLLILLKPIPTGQEASVRELSTFWRGWNVDRCILRNILPVHTLLGCMLKLIQSLFFVWGKKRFFPVICLVVLGCWSPPFGWSRGHLEEGNVFFWFGVYSKGCFCAIMKGFHPRYLLGEWFETYMYCIPNSPFTRPYSYLEAKWPLFQRIMGCMYRN